MAMNKLSYGSFDASNTDIAFASTSGYTNPTSELETRKQLSYPLKELKTFINNTVSVDESDNAIQLVVDNGDLKYRTEPNGALIDLDFATLLATKQDTLVSGTNIKTVNSTSLLGSGDISVSGFAGIDTANVIYSTTGFINTSPYYTATADGFVVVRQRGRTNHISIGGEDVAGSNSGSDEFGEIWCPIKKGQVLRVYQTGNHTGTEVSNVYVYGLKE